MIVFATTDAVLQLHDNQLTSVPEGIGNLLNLTQLSVNVFVFFFF